MLRPIYLRPGDKVALISPSGIATEEQLANICALLVSWGLEPVPGKHVLSSHGILAGTDAERLDDLQTALDAEEIRAIWCMTGNYGMLRIVQEADYSIFQGNPKWVIGMDDITILHAKLHSLGIESLHGFMPSDYKKTDLEAITQLRNFLFGIISPYAIPAHPLNRTGIAETEMIGGMLQWVHDLHDTCIERNTKGTILFLEDPSNNLYEIDKSIKCMKYAGKFQHLAGLIVGGFGSEASADFKEEVYKLIYHAVEDYSYPICFGIPSGHIRNNFPLILGANVELVVNPQGAELHFP